MSHHYSGLDFGFPHGDARLDFTGSVCPRAEFLLTMGSHQAVNAREDNCSARPIMPLLVTAEQVRPRVSNRLLLSGGQP
jgi:hypothetical protein